MKKILWIGFALVVGFGAALVALESNTNHRTYSPEGSYNAPTRGVPDDFRLK